MQTTKDIELPKKIAETMEEIALIEAIRKGLDAELVKREEVFKLIQDKKSELPLLP